MGHGGHQGLAAQPHAALPAGMRRDRSEHLQLPPGQLPMREALGQPLGLRALHSREIIDARAESATVARFSRRR